MISRICILSVAVSCIATIAGPTAEAQSAITVFRGRPVLKVSEGGIERVPEQLNVDRAANLECVVSQIGDRFYWASRENVELQRRENGAFITFVAVNGAGYVRTVKPDAKAAASMMSATEEQFDYVEHAAIGLRSVTYYGRRR